MITRRFNSNLMNTTVKILQEILYIFRISYMYVTIVLQVISSDNLLSIDIHMLMLINTLIMHLPVNSYQSKFYMIISKKYILC